MKSYGFPQATLSCFKSFKFTIIPCLSFLRARLRVSCLHTSGLHMKAGGCSKPPTRHVGKLLAQACHALRPKAVQQWHGCVIATQSLGEFFVPSWIKVPPRVGKRVNAQHKQMLWRTSAKLH